jgi:hypothetical protein
MTLLPNETVTTLPAVKRAHDGEKQECGCGQIAYKKHGKSRETNQEHRLAREGIDHESAEGTQQQCRDGIAREHQANRILGSPKRFAQVERKQWGQNIKGEE